MHGNETAPPNSRVRINFLTLRKPKKLQLCPSSV